MSQHFLILQCDRCPRGIQFAHAKSIGAVRREAKTVGWSRKGGADLCQECTKIKVRS